MPRDKSITEKAIGTRVRALREMRHDSQEKLAQALNVSRELISKIESGRQYPSVIVLAALSEKYSVSVDHILFGDSCGETLAQSLDQVIVMLQIIQKSL